MLALVVSGAYCEGNGVQVKVSGVNENEVNVKVGAIVLPYDNFIHIEKDGECFEIAIFLNKDKFMLVSTVKDKNGCINFIKKYGYLLEALNMSFSTNDGKIVDCLCIDVQECDCK